MEMLAGAAAEALDARERSLVNPLGLEPHAWLGAVAVKTVGVALLDPVVLTLCWLIGVAKMPSRTPEPIMKGLERLTAKDWAFLAINQFVEAVGMMHFLVFALDDEHVRWAAEDVSLVNTLGFVVFMFVVDDFFYYWAHRAMHLPSLYPWVHKHHHRNSLPSRGYLDAANESPGESLLGLSLVRLTLHLSTLALPSVHAAGVMAFTLLYATTAFLNHTPFDVQAGALGLGLGYSVRAHESHHRFPTCNYAQNVMLWDKLLGTYQDYRPGAKRA